MTPASAMRPTGVSGVLDDLAEAALPIGGEVIVLDGARMLAPKPARRRSSGY